MKNLLFAAFIVLTVAACSKKSTDVVTPDVTSSVVGSYTLTYIRWDSAGTAILGPYNLPLIQSGTTVGSGIITVAKVANDSISLTVRLVASGSQDLNLPYGNFGLKASGAGYTLMGKNQGFTSQSSTIDSKSINIDLSYPDSQNPKAVDRDVYIGSR